MASNVTVLAVKERGEGRRGYGGESEEAVQQGAEGIWQKNKDTHQDEREKNEGNIDKEVKKRAR